MNALIKKLTPEESAAELAALGRCPICAAKLVDVPCPDCIGNLYDCPPANLIYCPTCQNTGKVTICPNAHRGE